MGASSDLTPHDQAGGGAPAADGAAGLSDAARAETPAQIVERYDGWAEVYDTDVRSWGYTLPEDLAGLIVAEGPVGRLLDAGCGTGLVGQALRDLGIERSRLFGIDASSASLRVAAERMVYDDVAVVDLQAGLPFDTHSFGAVACGGVLTYITELDLVLREFVRVTRPGGAVIVTQRTDLWVERETDEVLARLRAEGHDVEVGAPVPYLPDLAEYGREIEVIYATIRVRSRG